MAKISFHQPISLYRKIAYTFLGLTVAVILVILYFSLASASIKITPERTDLSVDFIQTVEKAGGDRVRFVQSDLTFGGSILMADKVGTKSFTAEVTGEGVPAKARGTIKIINTSSRAQPLVATTRFLSKEGVLFRLIKGVTVLANGQIEAEAAADQPGPQGQIGPSEFTIPGLQPVRQKEVFGRSELAMTGGLEFPRLVTQAGLDGAQQQLVNELISQAKIEWAAQLPSDLKVLENSVVSEVVNIESSAQPGEEVEEFVLTVQLSLIGLALTENQLFELALNQLRAKVPADQELVNVDQSSLSYSAVKFDPAGETLNFKISLKGAAQLRPSSPVFDRNVLAGLSVDQASEYLKSLPGVEDANIKLSPFWVRRIPRLKDHINIVVER